MPNVPPTLTALEAKVTSLVAVPLGEAGELFRALDEDNNPITPAIRDGIRLGLTCVGIAPADSLNVSDADVANLTAFAVQRVVAEAEKYALERALMVWHRALQRYEEQAIKQTPDSGGWLYEEKRNVRERVAELKAQLASPYREPADPMVVSDPLDALEGRSYLGWPCRGGGSW